MKNSREWFAGLSVAALLTACGGGGGGGSTEDLILTFDYSGQSSTFSLWEPMTATPGISGLEGHSPHCSVSEGKLPQGLTLNASNCVVSGTPTEAGDFGVTIQLTVSGFSGNVTASLPVGVRGPTPSYSYAMNTRDGMWAYAFEDTPQLDWYKRKSGDTVSFEVLGGLPSGVTLDTQTGALSGTPSEFGEFQPQIVMTTTRDGRTHKSGQTQATLSVRPPVLDMFYDESDVATIGQEHDFSPALTNSELGISYHDYSYMLVAKDGCPASLPAGWTLTPERGRVTGTASAAMDTCVGVRLQVRESGLTANFDAVLKIVAK